MGRAVGHRSTRYDGRALRDDPTPLEALSGVTTAGALIGWGTLALIVVSTMLPHTHPRSMEHMALYAFSAAAAVANGTALVFVRSQAPRRWRSAVLWAWAVGLTLFLAIMTYLGGGASSDLYALAFPAVVFAATVLPSPAGALSGMATSVLYAAAVVAAPEPFLLGDLAVRSGALVATGVVAAELARMLRREATRRAAVQAQAETRATLLQELHHRVKNDLQTVSELLSLEGHRHPGGSRAELVDQTVNRIQSIAAVHQLLAVQPGTADATELAARVAALRLRHHDRPLVTLAVEGAPLALEVERATCLALVVNELVTNALDHGLPQGRPGAVTLRLALDGTDGVLTIADDGVGLPEGPTTDHLGLSLVRRLARDGLGGEFDLVAATPGTVARLRFPHRCVAQVPHAG